MSELEDRTDNTVLAVELASAWLSNPSTRVGANDVASFLKTVHSALEGLNGDRPSADAVVESVEYEPAVSVRKSLASKDHIISMIDGRPYKMLRRHLTTHGLTPDQYRERFGLKPDYPMVAPSYSETRSAMARKFGLGNKK